MRKLDLEVENLELEKYERKLRIREIEGRLGVHPPKHPAHNEGVLDTAFVTTTTQPMKEQQILQDQNEYYGTEGATNQDDEFIEGQY